MQVMAKNHSGGGSGEPLEALGRQVQFWTSFSEKMCENPAVLHGLGTAQFSEADQADQPDQPDQPDEGKMVHDRQFGP